MIGLKRGTVKLAPHNKKWVELFEKEKKILQKKLGDSVVDIQHIGSTAIPGIPAKPIIDISLGIHVMKDAKELIKPLKELGYELRPEFGGPNIQRLFVKGPESKRTHYLHVMKFKGSIWNKDLLFRDYLRKYREQAKQYADLKRKLAKNFVDDRGRYTTAKAKFIHDILKQAREDQTIEYTKRFIKRYRRALEALAKK